MKTVMRLGSGLILLGLLAACGGASVPAAETPKSTGEPGAPAEAAPTSLQYAPEPAEPATLAEAEQLLEKARVDLDRLALNEPVPPAAAGAAAPAPAPAQEAPRDKRRAEKSATADEAESAAPAKEAGSCETACKAFASLERASDAVCRLDTEGGQRCARARQIRVDASRRVASCACTR